MARADLLLNLVRTGSRGDQPGFRRTVEALIAEERSKQHHVLAEQLNDSLRQNGTNGGGALRPVGASGLLVVQEPRRQLDDLMLPDAVKSLVAELVEEHHRRELLESHGLEPRNRVLLVGPPGNGKTSLAEALACALGVPMLVVRYEALIGSYLGETASRLGRLFEEARQHRCVLFFDEFETLGKERGDEHETGEVKRVVSSLLLQIDALPPHCVAVTATNHPELLDRAVWRRFQLRLELPTPTRDQRVEFFHRFMEASGLTLGLSPRTLANRVKGTNFSELEDFCLDLRRRLVLEGLEREPRAILEERIGLWRKQYRNKSE